MPLDIHMLRALRPDTEFHYFRTIGSTMTEASTLAGAGAPHGTIILADEQTAGMGRLGRSWLSEAESGIYCSILLRLAFEIANFPVASLLLGLATAEAIQECTALACDLRWPNDVLIHNRKVAGILTQLVDHCIVAGIGINVNQRSFDPELRTPATSLLIENKGRAQPRESIVVSLLESIDSLCLMLANEGPESILRAFTSASSYAFNRRVIIEDTGLQGTTAGLDENGFLLVRSDSGQVDRIAAGGVRPAD